jgi:flagellar motor switch protein FliG
MTSTSIATVVKMMETLPEPAQDKVAEYVRQFIQEMQDEFEWDDLFKKNRR